jgi:hypothetical protein
VRRPEFEKSKETDMATEHTQGIKRRTFLAASSGLAALPLIGGAMAQSAESPISAVRYPSATASGRRRLATLEVSAIGLGVQNMSRTYQTTIPTRTEMHNIIRTAFDRGVTFFDAAEAYGPHEVERILGEALRASATKSLSRRNSAGTLIW